MRISRDRISLCAASGVKVPSTDLNLELYRQRTYGFSATVHPEQQQKCLDGRLGLLRYTAPLTRHSLPCPVSFFLQSLLSLFVRFLLLALPPRHGLAACGEASEHQGDGSIT